MARRAANAELIGNVIDMLQEKRFEEAARTLDTLPGDPSALFLKGLMQRYGSLGTVDLAGAAKTLEVSARGHCVDAATALADMMEEQHAGTQGPAREKARGQSETWRLMAVAMGNERAAISAALGFAPTGQVEGELDAARKANAARAIAWVRIAVKGNVEGASDLEKTLVNDFSSAVPASVKIQEELEATIASERAKVGPVFYMQLPAEFFLPRGTAQANDARAKFDAAYASYDNEEYQAALEAFMPMAKDGDIEAAFYVGRIHEMGYVGRPNGAVAERWYLRAAEGGIHAATANLGYMYLEGRSVPKNPERSTDYFLIAAYGGNLEGAVNVGFAYGTGQGRTKDLVEAHAWYSVSAAEGIESAVNNRSIIEREMTQQQIADAEARYGILRQELRGERRPALALPALAGARRDGKETARSTSPFASPQGEPSSASDQGSAPAATASAEGPAEVSPGSSALKSVAIHDDVLGGMQSHELQLPDGWNLDAGLSWNPRDAMAHVNVDAIAMNMTGAEVRFLPSGSFTHFTEMKMPQAPPHPSEGDFVGGAMFLDPGTGPEEFVRRVIMGSYRSGVQRTQVVSVTEAAPVSRFYTSLLQPMIQQMQAGGSQPGATSTHSVSCPVVRVRYVDGGRPMEEEFTFLYARFDMNMDWGGETMSSTLWYVFDARALRAPEGELDALRPAMRQIAQSLRPTRPWAAMLDRIRLTFYGSPETFQSLQGLDHAAVLAKLKQHVAPLPSQSAQITEEASESWAELTRNFDALDLAWAEALGIAPFAGSPAGSSANPFGEAGEPSRKGGFRVR